MRERYYSKDSTVYAKMYGRNEDNGRTIFSIHYNGDPYGVFEEHDIKLYEWAKHLHGNAPSGTPYGYFRASRNGKRVIITV